MSDFIKVESKYLRLDIFASARVPLVYKKKFQKGMIEDAQTLVMDVEKSVFLIHQCYLAACRITEEKPTISEDDIFDKIPATDVIKAVISIIRTFTDEITEITGQKKAEEVIFSPKKEKPIKN